MARFEYFSAEGQACVDKVVDWKVSFTDSNDEILPLVQGTDAPCASSDSICKLSKLAKSISETFTISSGKESFEWTMDSSHASLMGEQPLIIVVEISTTWKEAQTSIKVSFPEASTDEITEIEIDLELEDFYLIESPGEESIRLQPSIQSSEQYEF